jgi:hypothetical protein
MDQVNTGVRFRYKLGRGLLLIAVGLLLLGWLLNTPPGIFGKADAVGYAVCHRPFTWEIARSRCVRVVRECTWERCWDWPIKQ